MGSATMLTLDDYHQRRAPSPPLVDVETFVTLSPQAGSKGQQTAPTPQQWAMQRRSAMERAEQRN